jgi:hypothetical protein
MEVRGPYKRKLYRVLVEVIALERERDRLDCERDELLKQARELWENTRRIDRRIEALRATL